MSGLTSDVATRQDIAFGAFVVEAAFLGETAAFALGDGSVRLIADGEERIVPLHEGAILTAAASSDELFTGGDDGRVMSVNARGDIRQLAERPRKWIDQLAVAGPNRIAFATGRQAVAIDNGNERVLDLPRAVGGLAFAPKGYRLAIARYNGVTLWMPATEAEPGELSWDGAHIAAIYSPDGKHVVTAMQENALHGWRLSDGRDMRMSGYPAKSRSMSWSWKGRYLASSGANAAILWPFFHKEGPMGQQPLQLGPREALVTRVACHPRRDIVAIGYQDGAIISCGFEDGVEMAFREPAGSPISALGWDSKGMRLAFGAEDGAGGIVDIEAE